MERRIKICWILLIISTIFASVCFIYTPLRVVQLINVITIALNISTMVALIFLES